MPIGAIGFRDLCPTCGKELHSCRHCSFYKPGAFQDCAETVPEAVHDKDRMNFCEYFKPNPASVSGDEAMSAARKAKDAFNNLFKQ